MLDRILVPPAHALDARHVEDPVACVLAGPGVDPEGADAQMVPHGPHGLTAVVDLGDLVELRNCVLAHGTSSLAFCDEPTDDAVRPWSPTHRRATLGASPR